MGKKRIDVLLVERGLFESRAKAKVFRRPLLFPRTFPASSPLNPGPTAPQA